MDYTLKNIFGKSSIIYAEFIRVKSLQEELCLLHCSEQMASIIGVQLNKTEMVPLTEIDFFFENNQIDWMSLFEKVLRTDDEIVFEYDCVVMNKYMQVKVFSPEEEHLIAIFNDITDQIEVSTFSETLASMSQKDIDYKQICHYVKNLSGASFAILNLYVEESASFMTSAISGDQTLIGNVVDHMGIKLIGHEWPVTKELKDKILSQRTTRYKSFRELSKGVLPDKLIDIVESIGSIGEVYIVSIVKDGVLIGDINFLMKKGSLLRQKRLIEGIASQISMVLEQNQTQKDLYESKEMFQSIFLQAPFGIGIIDINNLESLNINQRYCDITGRSREELLSVDWRDITHPEDIDKDLDYTKRIMSGDFSKRSIEKRYIKPDGSYVWIEMSIVPIYNTQNIVSHHIIMCDDITYRKKMAAKTEYLSYHDELTGLYNRHFYEVELKRLDESRNLPMSLVFADVNGLKMTNDAYGHNAGDVLLKRVGDIIKKECRKSEIVARVGGDEFIILLPRTNKKQAEVIIKRLTATLDKTSVNSLILSVSFGLAVKNKDSEDIKELIISAEKEMYKNKLIVSQDVKARIFNAMLDSLKALGEDEKWHSIVIGELLDKMGIKLGFTKAQVIDLMNIGFIHDIGKVGLSKETVQTKDRLNKQNLNEMRRHPEIGYQIVSAVNEYSALAESILAHHERWDGKGYPSGLKGELIPIEARILAIADAYEVMTGARTYNERPLSKDDAIKELLEHSGTQFDPQLVGTFIEVINNYNDPRFK